MQSYTGCYLLPSPYFDSAGLTGDEDMADNCDCNDRTVSSSVRFSSSSVAMSLRVPCSASASFSAFILQSQPHKKKKTENTRIQETQLIFNLRQRKTPSATAHYIPPAFMCQLKKQTNRRPTHTPTHLFSSCCLSATVNCRRKWSLSSMSCFRISCSDRSSFSLPWLCLSATPAACICDLNALPLGCRWNTPLESRITFNSPMATFNGCGPGDVMLTGGRSSTRFNRTFRSRISTGNGRGTTSSSVRSPSPITVLMVRLKSTSDTLISTLCPNHLWSRG